MIHKSEQGEKPNMKKSILSLLFILTALMMNNCTGEPVNKKAMDPVPVISQRVERVSINREISASGNIEGNKTARLGFLVAGKINYIAGEEGVTIGAGKLLASLDPENYRIAKEMADANLAQVQDEFNRLSVMHERKSLSEGDFSKISNALKAARAQQQLQNKNLLDTRLYAPFQGVLLKKGAETGEIISAGMPLFVLSDISRVKVIASIPEADLQKVKIGAEARIDIAAVDSTMTGRIIEVGSVSEPTTRAFNVKIELKNPGLKIRPGMTAEVKIASGQPTETIAVPAEAVLRDLDNSACVFVVDEKKSQAFKRKVSLGQMTGNNIEIISGIAPGEMIVVGGQHKLNDGSPITFK
ncbi:MAG TPA: efflux RND transporter periplasmic adaptor subunit [Smithella sp.]|nr:efflux RND transporter periplasmic adaptor subunit [Smithella sp.]HNY51206.1 efflux RND transporter periplasmic adaptor subunit [Smithella sp.]HOG91371.1 efflux RND transporter periplasmic adaptor subunit [Smithella sp.]HOU51320.1 efflux RND transporter periplasmic adaptor subunit [Smithella sp.]HQI73963.1 efflux RND transporter periplasmic adaptor subunit [Smithella sp.]